MALSDYDKENVEKIIAGDGNWFTAMLLRLICKADRENLAKLYVIYPEEVNLIYKYKNGVDFNFFE